jgi:hypothetical protein
MKATLKIVVTAGVVFGVSGGLGVHGQSCVQPTTDPCCDHRVSNIPCDAQCPDCCPRYRSTGTTNVATGGFATGWPLNSYTTDYLDKCEYKQGFCVGEPPACDWPLPWTKIDCRNHTMTGEQTCGT